MSFASIRVFAQNIGVNNDPYTGQNRKHIGSIVKMLVAKSTYNGGKPKRYCPRVHLPCQMNPFTWSILKR